MKTFLLLAFSLASALAPFADAAKLEDRNQVKHPKKQQQVPPNQPTAIKQAPRIQPNTTVRQQTPVYRPPHINPAYTAPRVRQQTPIYRSPSVNPVPTKQAPRVRSWPDQDAARIIRPNQNPAAVARPRPNPTVVMPPQPPTTAPSKGDPPNRSDWDDRNRTDRNWRHRNSNNNSWEEACRRHRRHHHHRRWWRSHYTRFALFGSGYYFWDGGYWFPAYGYDPVYNIYTYDEPIYGYHDLDPGQVVVSVQTELQLLGYYRDAVDGWMGPNTRAALANYQQDNGLAITAAIDQPTLQSLRLE